MVSPIIPLILVFALFIVVNRYSDIFAKVLIYVYFLFGYVNVKDITTLTSVYLWMGGLIIIFSVIEKLAFKEEQNSNIPITNVDSKISKLFPIDIIGLVFGAVLTGLFFLMQSGQPGTIVGVPTLGLLATKAFEPSYVAILGIFENAFAIGMAFLFMRLPLTAPLGIFGGAFLGASIMAIFHYTAYSASIAGLLFAFVAFLIFILISLALKNSTAADTGHYWYNGITALGRYL